MSELQQFIAEVLERRGAAVEALGPDQLAVLAPAALQQQFGWPELAHLDFGTQCAEGTIAIAIEGDWLERFGALLGEQGAGVATRGSPILSRNSATRDPERLLNRALRAHTSAIRATTSIPTPTKPSGSLPKSMHSPADRVGDRGIGFVS